MEILNTKDVVSLIAGGQQKFADAIGIKQPSVSYRIKHDIAVSGDEAVLIELATGLSREKIRPDLFGNQKIA